MNLEGLLLKSSVLQAEELGLPSESVVNAPYGLRYGMSSQIVRRMSQDEVRELQDSQNQVLCIENSQAEVLKERQRIRQTLLNLVECRSSFEKTNLTLPSQLFSRSKRKNYVIEAPSLLHLSKLNKRRKDNVHVNNAYRKFIENGPRYVDNNFESPLGMVTVHRKSISHERIKPPTQNRKLPSTAVAKVDDEFVFNPVLACKKVRFHFEPVLQETTLKGSEEEE